MGSNTSTNILDGLSFIVLIFRCEQILFASLMSYFLVCLYLHYPKEESPSNILQQISMDTQDEIIMKEEELKEELKWLEQIRNVSGKIILELETNDDVINWNKRVNENSVKEEEEEELKEELKWLEQIRNVSGDMIVELEKLQQTYECESESDDDEDDKPEPVKKPDHEHVINDEIDITKFKIAKFGDTRYAMMRDAVMSGDIDLYAITDYVNTKVFKIVSLKPVGKFNIDTKKVKLIN
jgi:isoleucyl-tRNA synthetase